MSIGTIKKRASPIFKRHGVHRAAIFGSVARQQATLRSDVDFLVEFRGRKSLFDLVALEDELTKTLRRKADVVTRRSLHPLLKRRIEKESVRIYG